MVSSTVILSPIALVGVSRIVVFLVEAYTHCKKREWRPTIPPKKIRFFLIKEKCHRTVRICSIQSFQPHIYFTLELSGRERECLRVSDCVCVAARIVRMCAMCNCDCFYVVSVEISSFEWAAAQMWIFVAPPKIPQLRMNEKNAKLQ